MVCHGSPATVTLTMPAISFTATDVARILRLPGTDAVEDLVRAKVLEIYGHTRRGRPLFDAESVRRAAERIQSRGQERA